MIQLPHLLYLTVKRYFKNPLFLLSVLFMPVFTFMLSNYTPNEDDGLQVAIYMIGEDKDDLLSTLDSSESIMNFIIVDSEEELRTMVGKGQAECGYFIPGDLLDHYMDGEKKNLVTVVTNSSSSFPSVINTTIYSMFYSKLSEKLITRYLTTQSAISSCYPNLFSAKDVHTLYRKYLDRGSTFSFSYANQPNVSVETSSANMILTPLPGLLVVLLLISGFSGALSYYQDADNPIYHKALVRAVSIAVPLVLSLIPTYLCLCYFTNLRAEVESVAGYLNLFARLLFYVILCFFLLFLLSTFVKNRNFVYAFLPMYTMGCLLFSPVFIDITRYLPVLRAFSFLFLPTWYLAI